MAQLTTNPANGHAVPVPGRSALPDRSVTAETIEDAYVAFIFYCNPALPADCDTETLREAFRNPPRSGGKVFDPFAIYELVRRFYSKEIKTWTELTTKLGVEPPDPSKEESVQKIAQYGVRLKKWLHSMHVKAFFEYLMEMANDYWTNIPMDPNPVAQPVRDGIAVEDDMALRALLPYIRPKRGRKRPDSDNAGNGPNQRQRTSPGATTDEYVPQSAWLMENTPLSAWPPHETIQTPLTRWPASAVTPSVRDAFWGDEPRSAVTPSKAKGSHQRRGAKNVSSAWKLGGEDKPKKTRGRPPINRTPVDTPTTAATAWPHTPNPLQPQDKSDTNGYMESEMSRNSPVAGEQVHPAVTMQDMSQPQMTFDHSQQTPYPSHNIPQNQQDGSRPARPSISLQVPQRPSGSVRLATPPPPPPPPQQAQQAPGIHAQQMSFPPYGGPDPLPTYDNMHAPPPGQPYAEDRSGDGKSQKWEPINAAADAYTATSDLPGGSLPEYYFETMADRTNIDALMAYFIRMTHESDWYDEDGKPTEAASMEEASAIINATLENMYKTAASSQAFLINLAALAGARMLMTNVTRCIRMGEKGDHTAYKCEWEYQFGHLHGYFNMAASVPFSMWRAKKTAGDDGGKGSRAGSGASGGGGSRDKDDDEPDSSNPRLQAEHWQNKYKSLLGQVDKMDKELFDLRNKVIDSLKVDRGGGTDAAT
ncbi:ARS binding protein 2 [Akanthomyces lecanii RCEF 1005]|uniref:ARS binding protein 2 n=1 Tax=Akanthomyces lecanii RCEF 1005 TaxID=1081108 RepID=A0A168GLE6_CORDF|nr:ARS binding protein 2 [Akanthomyces lecanii RCEF 1005]